MKSDDIITLLRYGIRTNKQFLLVGPPGIGKTSLWKQASEAEGATCFIDTPSMSDGTDIKGMPWIESGKADFVPYGNILSILDGKPKGKIVYVFDDLGQALPSVQASIMPLLDRNTRAIFGKRIDDNVIFGGATNRREDRAGVNGILEPLKSRFDSLINMDVDLDRLVKFLMAKNSPIELIAFLRFRPELIHKFEPSRDLVNSPCPRQIEKIGIMQNDGLPAGLEFETFSGTCGEGFASEYMAFLKMYRSLPQAELIIASPNKASVPNEPDVLYATCGMLANKAKDTNIDAIMTYASRLPAEFQVLLVKDMINHDKDLVNTRAFISWASENSNVII